MSLYLRLLTRRAVEVKRKAVQRIEEQLMKLQVQATDREENKQIALGTSKLNYLDPRISVAWYLCTVFFHLMLGYFMGEKLQHYSSKPLVVLASSLCVAGHVTNW